MQNVKKKNQHAIGTVHQETDETLLRISLLNQSVLGKSNVWAEETLLCLMSLSPCLKTV